MENVLNDTGSGGIDIQIPEREVQYLKKPAKKLKKKRGKDGFGLKSLSPEVLRAI